MRTIIIGIIIGLVVGIMFGTTIIAPRLKASQTNTIAHAQTTNTQQAEQETQPATTPAPQQTPPYTNNKERWRMASAFASALPQLGTQAKRIETQIANLSGGEMQIQFYEPGQLVQPNDQFDAVASGTIDAAFASPGQWRKKSNALQLFSSIPFGPGADEYTAWFYFGGGQKLFEEILHPMGVHGLVCGMIAPEASGWFKKPVNTPEDFKGLRMRIFGLGAQVIERLGAEAVELNEGEIFLGLENGSLDAAEFSMPAIDARLDFHKMARHYYFPGWHQPATLLSLLVNLDRWNALSQTQQTQIESVCGDNVRFALAEGEALQYPALKSLVAKGVEVHRWPNGIIKMLEIAWQDVVAEEAGKDRAFSRVWHSLSSFRRDYAIWRELAKTP